jgi:putative serine protease PepD
MDFGNNAAIRADQFYVEQNKIRYQVVEIRNEIQRGLVYVKVNANGLMPMSFAKTQDFLSGDQVVIVNGLQQIQPASVLSLRSVNVVVVDDFARPENWKLNVAVSGRSIVFDTAGQFVGFTNATGEVLPVHRFTSELRSFLSEGVVQIPTLGVRTVDLTSVSNLDGANFSRLGNLIVEGGVLVGGSAEEAGLVAGDVITAINGNLLTGNLTLSEILQGFAVGDDVRVTFVRGGVEQTLIAKLKSAN